MRAVRGLCVGLALLGACARGEAPGARAAADAGAAPVSVDVEIARRGRLVPAVEIVGTTRPHQEVVVRARVEGRLLSLAVDVGDAVRAGQVVARLEDDLPRQASREAAAALAAARAEAASAAAARGEAQVGLDQARVEADRYAALARRGIVSREQAEQRATAARSSVQQLENQRALVAASGARVAAQQALAAQARERLSYVTIAAPIAGRVLERASEPGSLLAAGDAILRIGALDVIEVVAAVSELDLARVEVGGTVSVRLDAFPGRTWPGRVARVSPQADAASRLVPVEIVVANPDGRIGAGLLARVPLEADRAPQVLIPASALAVRGAGGEGAGGAPGRDGGAGPASLFVLEEDGGRPVARARAVVIGERAEGRVEVLEGLEEGARVVARSARPLRPGAPLRPSAISPAPAARADRPEGGAP